LENKRWKIVDDLHAKSWKNVVTAVIIYDQTAIYNVISRTLQIGQLQYWFNLVDEAKKLLPSQPLEPERNF